MQRLLVLALITGCTCGAADVPSTPAPTAAPTTEPTTEPTTATAAPTTAPTVAPEAPAPTPPTRADAVAWRTRLREARRLAHAGQNAEAYAIFAALLRDRPSARGLRCEAGFVAFRAGQLDDADRQIGRAIDGWPTPPPARERVAFAMCLYNRGLVSEARGDHATAADAWRRSLALRPNATVQSHLDGLGDLAPAAPVEEEEDEADADGAFTFADWLDMMRDEWLDDADVEVTEIEGGTPERTLHEVRVVEIPEDDDPEIVTVLLALSTPTDVVELERASYQRYNSWYDDEVALSSAELIGGPPDLGALAIVATTTSGRGDAPEGGHTDADEASSETRLHICAERRDWACIDVPIEAIAESECDLCESDDEEYTADEPYVPYVRGYSLTWSIEGADLVLGPNPEVELTDPEPPPRTGHVSLASLFAAAH